MRARIVSLLFIFFLLILPVQAQSRQDQPFVLPQTVFVGDLARLVVPLSNEIFSAEEPFIVDTPERLPQSPELLIRRIELERRGGVSRLLIDFIPFVPGTIYFPEIEFRESMSLLPIITDIEVQVTSILNPAQVALSAPASPLAIPGTSFLIYGTVALILTLLFLGIGGSVWGRRHFWEFWEGVRRRIFLFRMKKFIKLLRREISLNLNIQQSPVHYLSLLSAEFREFLSLFTGINCRSLTSGEFLVLPFDHPGPGAVFLSGLFQTWDTLRFSGRGMEMVDLTQAMDEIEDFLVTLIVKDKDKEVKK